MKPKLLPILTSGVILGLMETAFAISLAALIFSGPLAEFRSLGIGLALLGAAVSTTVIVLFTSLPGVVSGLQEAPAVILSLVAVDILAGMPLGASQGALLISVLAAILLCTLVTGLGFLALGYFKLGNLVRFLPYPVIGGFLAATGWLVLVGGFSLMVPLPESAAQVGVLFQPEMLLRWLPGVVLAVLMFIGERRGGSVLVIPLLLIVGTILFYVLAFAWGVPAQELHQEGWVLGPFPEGALWRPFPFQDLHLVQWGVIAKESAHIGVAVLVSVISLLLNVGGLELAAHRDLRVNRELDAAGVGNILAALVSGMVGFQKLGGSTINFRIQANHRLTGLIMAAIFAGALIFGGRLLSLFPILVVSSLLLYLGLDFLTDWVVETRRKMPRMDYAILLAILVVTIFIGFLEAIALGLLLAVLLFIVGYSRIDVVRLELSGETYKSRVVRPRRELMLLAERGERIFILELQGFIFFGTANQLLERVRQRLNSADLPAPSAILFDFRRVSGIDSTTILSFSRMVQLGNEAGASLAFVATSGDIAREMVLGNLGPDQEGLFYYPTMDQAVQWAEDRLLEQVGQVTGPAPATIEGQLQAILGQEIPLDNLLAYFEKHEVQAGQVLIPMGEKACDLFFIESGQVTAQIPRAGGPDVRLESVGAGHVVGEIGLYLQQERTAEVVVDQPGVVYRLSDKALQDMEETDAQAASTLHYLVAILLSERMVHLTHSLNALEE